MTRVFSLAPIVFGVLGVLGILCSGCSILEPREDPTRFFVLSPGGAETLAPESDAKLSITVGPLRLPAYLLRPEIVTRAGENELDPSPFDRWAEPIDGAILRVSIQADHVHATIVPIDAGLRGAPARPAHDPALILELFDALGSTALERSARSASF